MTTPKIIMLSCVLVAIAITLRGNVGFFRNPTLIQKLRSDLALP